MPPRRRRLQGLHLAEVLQRPPRRPPQLRSPRRRPGRQHRPDPRSALLHRRHQRSRDDDRLRSLGADQRPTAAAFEFSSEPGAAFQCRLDAAAFSACTWPQSYTPALADGPHTFEVRAVDQAGNADPTPASRSFTVDTQAPAAPSLAATSPASPANNNSPKVQGSAEAGSVVQIYSTSDCGGVPLATGSAAELASPGITVSVPDNSTTALRATATDVAGNLSACSAGLAYVEDSTPPETTIGSGPSGPDQRHLGELRILLRSRDLAAVPPQTAPPSLPAPRRRPTAPSPTAPTTSKSAPSTRPATPTRPPQRAPSPSTRRLPRRRSTPAPGADQQHGRRPSNSPPSPAAAFAVPPRRRRLQRLHARRRPTAPSPTAPTPSKCARSTRPATPTRPPPPAPSRSTPRLRPRPA